MSDHWAIYIHVPFCRTKCGYCDFYSIDDLSALDDYVRCLTAEIRLRSPEKCSVTSVYFGGGTPSLLKTRQVAQILELVHRYHAVSPDAEITLEANPGTIGRRFLADLKQAGINRLSIGVQSLDTWKLSFLNRIHTVRQALACIDHACEAGFDNIGIDLIYGIPGETAHGWIEELHRAQALPVRHLSCYMLTVEPGTPLYRRQQAGTCRFPSAEEKGERFTATARLLTENGYDHYEISNFARPGTYRSRHNCHYWDRLPYLGFGPAAHSFDGHTRSWNLSDVGRYVAELYQGRRPAAQAETLTRDQALLERVMLGLRTRSGIDVADWDRTASQPFARTFDRVLRVLNHRNWCRSSGERLALTLEGQAFLNPILEMFAADL